MFTAIRRASSRVSKSGCRIAGRIFLLRVLISAFVFTNIAKFSRAFDEAALSSCSFFASCSLIAKAVDFSACHLGCFAFGIPSTSRAQSHFFIHEN